MTNYRKEILNKIGQNDISNCNTQLHINYTKMIQFLTMTTFYFLIQNKMRLCGHKWKEIKSRDYKCADMNSFSCLLCFGSRNSQWRSSASHIHTKPKTQLTQNDQRQNDQTTRNRCQTITKRLKQSKTIETEAKQHNITDTRAGDWTYKYYRSSHILNQCVFFAPQDHSVHHTHLLLSPAAVTLPL